MIRNAIFRSGLIAVIFTFSFGFSVFSQGTAFNYQGQLNVGGSPAGGNYNFQFTVYNALTNGTAVSGTLTNYDVPVTNGLFNTTLDFGPGVFTGPGRWLDIGVETNGGTGFTMLSPLQPILPVPYAIFANSASNLVGVLAASQLIGTLPESSFVGGFTNAVALTNGANLLFGTFNGNGAAVTNVNVTNLTGVLADSQLPANTAYVNSNQTFAANNIFNGSNTFNGANTFTNLRGNSFSGSFFGNGLVGWLVVTGTTVQAGIDTGYLLTNSQNVIVTLPTSASPGDIVRIACAGISGWQLGQNAGQSVLGSFLSYGKSWVQNFAYDANWKSIASSPDGTVLAATYSGVGGDGAAVSKDSGLTWSLTSPGSISPTWQAIAVSPNDESIALAAASEPIYISTNLGSAWTQTSSGSYNWTGLAATANGNFVAVATGTGAGIYTNTGTTWVQRASGGTWTAVSLAAGGSELVAANGNGGVYVSTDGGGTWSEASAGAYNCIACSAAGNRMIAGVSGGALYISTNSGSSFTPVTALPTGPAWSGVASSSDGSKLEAVANGGYIYTSANWGTTWTTNTTSAAWTSVASSSSGSIAAAAINNSTTSGSYGIYTSQAGSQTVTTTGSAGYISGAQASGVELQCIGNNQFMPVSFYGTIWGN